MTRSTFSKISHMVCAALMAGMLFTSPAAAQINGEDALAVAEISQHFTSVPTMQGEFVQFGPNGEQTGGTFYLSRPGKIRFDYSGSSPITVRADGRTVGINNKKLKTWDFYPLSKTPLKLLLSDRIDVSDDSIKSVKRESDLTTIVMGNKSIFGNSKITLMFDPETNDLRQWTITDDQGKDTSVMIFNVQHNVNLPSRLFFMDKTRSRNPAFNNDGR